MTLANDAGAESLVVLTKADKVVWSKRRERVESIALGLGMSPDEVLVTSSLKREGQEALREAVLAFVP